MDALEINLVLENSREACQLREVRVGSRWVVSYYAGRHPYNFPFINIVLSDDLVNSVSAILYHLLEQKYETKMFLCFLVYNFTYLPRAA